MMSGKLPFAAKVAISIITVEVLGGLGGFITSQSIPDWYAGLAKPPGTPPNWVFGPVWVALYAMIGIAFAFLWHRGFAAKTVGVLFVVQLVLNIAWTPVFFGLHQMFFALIIIALLWLVLLATIAVCFQRSETRIVGFLLIPYFFWVSYATYLNVGYWYLNR